MATVLPQFKLRQLMRRDKSGIDQLAKQYKSSVDAITSEYQSAFGKYQADVDAKMAPFNAAMAEYTNVQMPAFEAAQSAYKAKIDAYNAQLEELARDPVVAKIGVTEYKVPRWGLFGLAGYETKRREFEYYEPKAIPEFREAAPSAPTAPTAPTIEPFNDTEFQQKRKETESTFKREVSERKAAKLGAVARRATRPLLQGA